MRVPQLSDTTDVLKFVAEGRADFTFVEPYLAEHFNKTSSVKLVATSENPIRALREHHHFETRRDKVERVAGQGVDVIETERNNRKID